MTPISTSHEWLEADGLGGFASGTTSGIRTRRYHALLLAASRPPAGRYVLVNGCDAWVETPQGRFMLSAQRYAPEVVGGDGPRRIKAFAADPWPRWTFQLEDGTEIEQEIVSAHGSAAVVVAWKLLSGSPETKLFVRPFFSGRDYHSLHRENSDFRFEAERRGDQLVWQAYAGVPAVFSFANGAYYHDPHWYRNFSYAEEQARGLDHIEDLASPGIISFDLGAQEAVWLVSTEATSSQFEHEAFPSLARAHSIRANERLRRQSLGGPLARAADAYLVRGVRGRTILAGYPWFTDWGRDTFIALRGLCLATGRWDDAREILEGWASVVSEGMVPNRFPDHGEEPEFNSVDASLWFVIAAWDYLEAARQKRRHLNGERSTLSRAICEIVEGYFRGTRFGIGAEADGLLRAGAPGLQLTWMDARVGDWVVTPRMGKPVEIQALWLNALWIAGHFDSRWQSVFSLGRDSFQSRFWNAERGMLYDVIDDGNEPGRLDGAFRPNQILAVGGLPLNLLEPQQARAVVDKVEEVLLTPVGLRSLAPGEPGYAPRYEGGVRQRDGSYHQGTVWPWLLGPFVEAWVRVRGETREAREQAKRFLAPVLDHLNEGGLGHISEILDADAPHTPRGCPFQAWSVSEVLRIRAWLESDEAPASAVKGGRGQARSGEASRQRKARQISMVVKL